MNRIGVFYEHILEAARQRGLDLPEVLDCVRGFGIEGVEASIDHINGTEGGFSSLMRSAGLETASVYAFFDFGHNANLETAFRAVDSTRAVGAERLLAIPGFIDRGEDREQATGRMVAALEQLCAYALSVGISITMEDFDDEHSPSATTEGLKLFLDRIPGLGCAFDTGNFLYSGEDAEEAFGVLSSRTVHVHLKDRSLAAVPGTEPKIAADGTALYPAAVGHGIIPMKAILGGLSGIGYDGWLSIEHFGASDQLACIESSSRWLREAQR